METAKIIKNGDENMVVLPKDFNLNNDEVLIRRIGNMIMLVPKEKALQTFMDGLNGFTEDFLPNGREPQIMKQRGKFYEIYA